MPSHLSDSFPAARQRYRCVGCWEFIEVGEKHLARRQVDGGLHSTSRWHPECEAFAFADGVTEYEDVPGAFSRKEATEYAIQKEPTNVQ